MARPGTAGYCIERDDGHYYLGTMDHNPLFGHGENAAVFKTEEEAQKLIPKHLEEKFPDRSFKIVPE